MPAKFHGVSPMVWDRTFRRLGKNAKLVALYAWTAPARTSEGLSRLPITYIAGDTAIPEGEVLSALEELQTAGIIDYDEISETLLDRSLKWNPMKSGVSKETGLVVPDKRQTGALKQIDSLIDSPLLPSFVELASEFSPDLATAIIEKYPHLEPSDKALGRGSRGAPKVREEKRRLREESIRAVAETDKSQSRGSLSGSDSGSDSDFDSQASKISSPATSQNGLPPGWTFLEGPEECVVCHSGCTQLDPEGVVQHYGCVEGGF